MDKVEIIFNQIEEAISVMREVAKWGREKGLRIWPEDWLTPEELITEEAQTENFCIGKVDGVTACSFILQWSDSAYWKDAPKYDAAYLHKFCNGRSLALYELEVDTAHVDKVTELEIGKCGFACSSCPTYRKRNCAGCMKEHAEGDCYTRDCVISKAMIFAENVNSFLVMQSFLSHM